SGIVQYSNHVMIDPAGVNDTAVDRRDADQLDVEAGFFLHFAGGGICWVLAELDPAARKCPLAWVIGVESTANQQDPSRIAEYCIRRDPRSTCLGAWIVHGGQFTASLCILPDPFLRLGLKLRLRDASEGAGVAPAQPANSSQWASGF